MNHNIHIHTHAYICTYTKLMAGPSKRSLFISLSRSTTLSVFRPQNPSLTSIHSNDRRSLKPICYPPTLTLRSFPHHHIWHHLMVLLRAHELLRTREMHECGLPLVCLALLRRMLVDARFRRGQFHRAHFEQRQ